MSRRGGRGGGRGGRAGGGGGRPPRLDAAQIGAYGKRMRAWFASLSVSERQLALAIEDAELIAMVRGMHALSQETGPLLFCSYVADADPKCFRDLVWRRIDVRGERRGAERRGPQQDTTSWMDLVVEHRVF
jgi:hypothetical protein